MYNIIKHRNDCISSFYCLKQIIPYYKSLFLLTIIFKFNVSNLDPKQILASLENENTAEL